MNQCYLASLTKNEILYEQSAYNGLVKLGFKEIDRIKDLENEILSKNKEIERLNALLNELEKKKFENLTENTTNYKDFLSKSAEFKKIFENQNYLELCRFNKNIEETLFAFSNRIINKLSEANTLLHTLRTSLIMIKLLLPEYENKFLKSHCEIHLEGAEWVINNIIDFYNKNIDYFRTESKAFYSVYESLCNMFYTFTMYLRNFKESFEVYIMPLKEGFHDESVFIEKIKGK